MILKSGDLLIADIDGTLVPRHGDMTPYAVSIVEKLRDRGVLFGIASGRPIDTSMLDHASHWGFRSQFDVLIGMNGGQLWDRQTDSFHEYHKLKTDTIREIVELMVPYNTNFFIYRQKGFSVTTLVKEADEMIKVSSKAGKTPYQVASSLSDFWAEETAKILFRCTDGRMPQIKEEVEKHPSRDWQDFLTQPTLLEFQDPRINKGLAVTKFCEIHQMDLKNVMAFGDMENDNEMLAAAGCGIALCDGGQSTRSVADEITDYPCDQDGLAHYLEDHCM